MNNGAAIAALFLCLLFAIKKARRIGGPLNESIADQFCIS